jgi:hypothetical protein
MSAIFRVLSGTARMRVAGLEADVTAPWEEAGIEYAPAVARPKDLSGIERFKAAVAEGMLTDLQAPAMGAADVIPGQGRRGQQVQARVQVEAVDDPVYLRIWQDRTSAHPDETFGRGAEASETLLQPGEVWEGNVAHQNAWTVIAVTG